MQNLQTYTTDVLVVGGGMAGCFAAIAARENDCDVILVDKGYVSSSGQTPFAGTLLVFDPEKDDRQETINYVRKTGDYVVNVDWLNITMDRSMECYLQMKSYGVPFAKGADGQDRRMKEDGARAVFPDNLKFPQILRKKVLETGATILDRIMVVELIMQDDEVCGVVGITVSDAYPVVIKAKKVILCTGASAFKPPSWPVSNLTGDGDMMAYRVGASITGKEFVDTHGTSSTNPYYMGRNPLKGHMGPPPERPPHGDRPPMGHPPNGDKPPMGHPPHGDRPPHGKPPRPRFTNALGEEVNIAGHLNLGIEFEIHKGNGPMVLPKGGRGPIAGGELVSCASSGMSTHKAEGILPMGLDCSTEIQNLYAAGDSLGTMTTGAAYATIGLAHMGSAVTGKIAGENASQTAKTSAHKQVADDTITTLFDKIYAPLNRAGGFSPRWVINLLQNLTMPYFNLIIKEETRLKSILSQVRYLKTDVVPKIKASDAHELRLALETANMVSNAEIKICASLERCESRGTHFREDYPFRDEQNFSTWISCKQIDGEMQISKHPIPSDWAWQEGEPRFVTFEEV
ncbi:MAG: hypothetical protein ATN35_03340 [Epulopiscium sp. Nele67-Bin004]|nr:MAG: hypothetical protein ATN35_03340 [Epulopiscium sp. Nele67-Bin004]